MDLDGHGTQDPTLATIITEMVQALTANQRGKLRLSKGVLTEKSQA